MLHIALFKTLGLLVTGSLQIKGLVYYVVLNVYPNNKRNQKWIPTTVIADGKKVNQMKAEKLLSDIRMVYDKDSYIDNKKTAEQLLEENKSNQLTLLSKNSENNKANILNLNSTSLSSEEELIITKCLSAWYNTLKEEMINSLINIIIQNPNTHLIKRIITDLVNKLSDDAREQRIRKMGHYRDMLFSDYIKEWLNSTKNQVAKSTYKGYYDHVNGRMLPYFENEEILLRDVSLADIYNYMEHLFSEGLKPNTVKHHRFILSCVFTRAVEQAIQRFKINGKTQFVFKDKTKSQSSYRTLPLFNFIEDLLLEYKSMYAEYKKIFGNTYNNNYKDYLCLMPNGELMKPGYLSHTFSKILEDNELKRIRLHDLRYSCATLLIQNKVPVKDIQIWLGHSNIQTTMIYTHLDETNKEVSAQVLMAKFQFILTNYNEDEIYEMQNQTLNNIYEQDIEKVVANLQNQQQLSIKC